MKDKSPPVSDSTPSSELSTLNSRLSTIVYLDYNATTPIAPGVQRAMQPFLGEQFGNPSSQHALGRASYEAVEDARGRVGRLLGAEASEIFFTSGGTESNNLAIRGVMRQRARAGAGHIVISAIEHPATIAPARYLESLGYALTVLRCDGQGAIRPEDVRRALQADTVLVSIMHANNEVGTIQPIAEIARICRDRGVLVHTDAAQSAGKIRTRVDELGVDLLSIAGHKLYAPKGIGALYVRRGTPIAPVLLGAGQESGLRPGTESVPFIVALGAAASLAEEDLEESCERMTMLRDRLHARLAGGIGESLTVNGAGASRLPNTLSVNFPDVIGSDLLRRVPGLCASTGAACHSGAMHVSATLAAMGLSPEVARGTVRLSVGRYTTEADVDRAADWMIEGLRVES